MRPNVSTDRPQGRSKADEVDSMREPLTGGDQFAFAGFVLDLGQRVLLDRQRQPVDLRPQAYEVLCRLALNAGRLVTKDELIASVWPDVVVTDDSLVQAI